MVPEIIGPRLGGGTRVRDSSRACTGNASHGERRMKVLTVLRLSGQLHLVAACLLANASGYPVSTRPVEDPRKRVGLGEGKEEVGKGKGGENVGENREKNKEYISLLACVLPYRPSRGQPGRGSGARWRYTGTCLCFFTVHLVL